MTIEDIEQKITKSTNKDRAKRKLMTLDNS